MPPGTADFVAVDRELESGHAAATEKLAEHRWRWTLDETNPDRVSLREYARRVGRSHSSIHRMAHGFEAFRTSGPPRPGGPVTLTDFIEAANLSSEKAEAAEAVAAVTGKPFAQVRTTQRAEIRDVLTTAQDRAERRGTTVSAELEGVARDRQRARQVHERERAERGAVDFRFVTIEGHFGAAIRRLREALALAREVDQFSDEEIELLEDSLAKIRALVNLVDLRISGKADVDWDEEFAKVMKEATG